MILSVALLINYVILFFLEIIGYHLCHSIVMVLNGYYHLCQVILCTVRIVSQRIQFTYTPRLTYGLARVGVVGELVAFVSFLSLSISIFLESIKHLYDVFFVIPKRETNSSKILTAHGHEHVHSLYDRPEFILGVGVYSMISNCILAVVLLFTIMQRSKQFKQQLKQRRPSNTEPIPKNMSDSLLITDTLPIQHSFLQILSMLLGPLALLTCGILLFILPHKTSEEITYRRAVDPFMGSLLFSYYLMMLIIPIREVVHLVLQAKPYDVNSDDIESRVMSSVPGVVRLHELHIWRLTPQKTLATVHVVFNTTESILTKYKTISFIFQTHHIDHVTIQPEFALSAEEIDQLDCRYQCSADNATCSPLQCCETSPAIMPGTSTSLSQTMHFRRRSSVDLNNGSDIKTEQEKQLLDNSSANTSASPLTNSSVVVTTMNEK